MTTYYVVVVVVGQVHTRRPTIRRFDAFTRSFSVSDLGLRYAATIWVRTESNEWIPSLPMNTQTCTHKSHTQHTRITHDNSKPIIAFVCSTRRACSLCNPSIHTRRRRLYASEEGLCAHFVMLAMFMYVYFQIQRFFLWRNSQLNDSDKPATRVKNINITHTRRSLSLTRTRMILWRILCRIGVRNP